MSAESNKLFCDQCNKLLQSVHCTACDGKGYIRKKLFLKNECTICEGRRNNRCPTT